MMNSNNCYLCNKYRGHLNEAPNKYFVGWVGSTYTYHENCFEKALVQVDSINYDLLKRVTTIIKYKKELEEAKLKVKAEELKMIDTIKDYKRSYFNDK